MTDAPAGDILQRLRTLSNPAVHWQAGIDACAREMLALSRRPDFRPAMESLHASDPRSYADAVALIWSQIGGGADLPSGEAFWQALERAE